MGTKRVTIQDIARKTGYSKTAVSFAFNCPSRISEAAVEKILSAAKELDYIPDPMARNFSLGKHMALGFLLPQKAGTSLGNPYIHSVIKGIAAECQSKGYMLTLIPPLHSSVQEAVKNATVDGIITIGIEIDRSLRGILRRRGMPIVSIDGSEDDEAISSVSIDDEGAAEMQMLKVLERGHRKIAVITLPGDAYSSSSAKPGSTLEKRKAGYAKALKQYSMTLSDVTLLSSDTTIMAGRKAAESILSSFTPTCFVSMSDAVAMGIQEVLSERKMDDVSVIGFDGIEEEEYRTQYLTTIVQSGSEKGRVSAQMLLAMIEDRQSPVMHRTVEYSFQEGRTLGWI